MLDFTYHNIGFDLKQLIEVLCCDLQVTIHEGLVDVQDDILKAIANFIDNFHIVVATLSAPQVHALLDHMRARCTGSHPSWLLSGGVQHSQGQSFSYRNEAFLIVVVVGILGLRFLLDSEPDK